MTTTGMVLSAYLAAAHEDHVRLGYRSGNCEPCTPSSWHEDARRHRLRPSVVGGVPVTRPISPPSASLASPSRRGARQGGPPSSAPLSRLGSR